VKNINDELQRKVGLKTLYPFAVADNPTANGKPCGGYFVGNVNVSFVVLAANAGVTAYLHEVCHLIANRTGIDEDPTGMMHNRFFGVLYATCLRRIGKYWALQVYDFQDGIAAERPVDGDELAERLRYIASNSEKFANSSMTIEQIASWLARNDHAEAWTASHRNANWWQPMAVGAALTALALAVFFLK
jgi:hypothetical protein